MWFIRIIWIKSNVKIYWTNTYTGIWSNFLSKTIPIHGPIQKSDLYYSYLRYHFSWLQQAVAKNIFLSQKFSFDFKIIDPVDNGFSPNEIIINFHIYDQSIVTFGLRGLCLWFLNTSHVNSLYRFRKLVVEKVKIYLCI